VATSDGLLSALPRPVSLKNDAIELIRARMPDAVIGPLATDTNKGTVAYLKAPVTASFERRNGRTLRG